MRPVKSMTRGRSEASGVVWVMGFVVVWTVALLIIVLDRTSQLLPGALATQVAHNSEAFTLAILLSLALWLVQTGRLPLGRALLGGAALLVLGIWVQSLDDLPRVKTLNEPILAAAVLLPYLALRRRPAGMWLVSVLVAAVIIVFHGTDLVRLQAETLVALMLAPIGFDLVDKGILRARYPLRTAVGLVWLAVLALGPFALMFLRSHDLGAFGDATVLYLARGNEAFWGLLFVHLLVAWVLPTVRVGRSPSA